MRGKPRDTPASWGPQNRKKGRKGIFGPWNWWESRICYKQKEAGRAENTPVHPGFKIFSKEQSPSAGLFGEEHKATLNRRGKEQDRHSTGSEEGQRDRQTQGGRKATLEGPHPSVHRCCGPGMQAVQMQPHPAVFQPHLEMAPRTEAVHPQPVCGSECPWAAVIASTFNG